jgi:glycine cleavage system transcriptional repressor
MPSYAVTVLGHDRPGIVADVTEAIAELGGNLEDSTMTLLRGHFAMTLIADVDAPAEAIADRLAPLRESGLVVSVLLLPAADAAADERQHYLVTVHGGDRPGIVSAVARRIADLGGNIVDLSTRLGDGLYVLIAEVQLVPEAAGSARAALREAAAELGVTIHLSEVDEDVM